MSAITNRARAAQLIEFENMRYGTIMPTDIDALIDMKGQAWVAIEVKSGNAHLSLGQKIAFERLVKGLEAGGTPAILIVARHKTKVTADVDLAKCKVNSYYRNGEWTYSDAKHGQQQTVRQFVDALVIEWNIEAMMEGGTE